MIDDRVATAVKELTKAEQRFLSWTAAGLDVASSRG